ncbi:MAG TPA: argininosuccinate lyase, partial [Candidatus Krumholzibacteria bacterium]|nr:argininosuccinate lyase [Candidatus Krumholzibacteria bacterium]
MKMWTGRFENDCDSDFEKWQRSFPYDRRLIGEEIAASKAYAYALEDAGVLTAAELRVITGALDEILAAGVPADDDPRIE